jgi:RNA polymerase sigma factor (sigma-70 family)
MRSIRELLLKIKNSSSPAEVDDAFRQLQSDFLDQLINSRVARCYATQRDDLRQEARLSVFKSIHISTVPNTEDDCRRYIYVWVRHGIAAALAPLNYKKRQTDKPVLSINHTTCEGSADAHHPASREADPLDILVRQEDRQRVTKAISQAGLTDLEFAALSETIFADLSYQEVAEKNDTTKKAIDNALCRATVKLRLVLGAPEPIPQNRCKGYRWSKQRQRWTVEIKRHGRNLYLGYYEHESAAAAVAQLVQDDPTQIDVIRQKIIADKKTRKEKRLTKSNRAA